MIDANWKRLMEFLELALAWPFLAFIAFVAFVILFRAPLTVFLSGVRLKTPFTTELPQQPVPTPSTTVAGSDPKIEDVAHPPAGSSDTPDTIVDEIAGTQRDQEAYFRQLNASLLLATQDLLDEINRRGGLPLAEYLVAWPDSPPGNQKAMFTELNKAGLIRLGATGDWILPTPRGQAYGSWHERAGFIEALRHLDRKGVSKSLFRSRPEAFDEIERALYTLSRQPGGWYRPPEKKDTEPKE